MLELDSARWAELHHAYGRASDIPDLLRSAFVTPYSSDHDNPWMELYSALCHQFTIETASYAAFPHLVNFARESSEPAKMQECMQLAASIEAERHMREPDFPEGLKEPYMLALSEGAAVSRKLVVTSSNEESMRAILGVVAVFHGQPRLGFSMMASGIEIECEACGNIQAPPYYLEFEE